MQSLEARQFVYTIDDGHSAGNIVRATVTQKAEAATPEIPAVAVLKCTTAVIDDQNTVQIDGVGDPMSSVYVTIKTRQTDGGEAVNFAGHVPSLVSDCIVEVVNRLVVHS
ncbi:hypothetical protein [Microbulbifer sp. GL-2]|uniref:hypothetical protein n=1 Tax=Microbulbifer sp. GL-2 TaxID=2591606 RepID=UPI0011649897|nr:hypothetical protein [Microbulbifer sp. GL-2]BBM02471.1 hypothetical protein GL2_25450 [Microbulbifer sp. GL-2]